MADLTMARHAVKTAWVTSSHAGWFSVVAFTARPIHRRCCHSDAPYYIYLISDSPYTLFLYNIRRGMRE